MDNLIIEEDDVRHWVDKVGDAAVEGMKNEGDLEKRKELGFF